MTNIIKVLSYNIWFEEEACIERLFSLIEIINKLNPDVICLQEVRPQIYEALISNLNDYRYHYPKKINKSYGCCNFSKYPITKCLDFTFQNSNMGRSLIITKIDYPYHNKTEDGISVDKVEVVVSNVHFESLFKKNIKNEIKLQQYEISANILNQLFDTYKNVILCSDTNLMEHEEDIFNQIFKDNSWKDLWELKGSDTNRYSYDSYENVHLQKRLPKFKFRSRIDRILFKSESLTADDFSLIRGDACEPSDHFGIYGKLSITKND